MNIPLDRLYHYIRDIAQEIYGDRIVIYRFWPHGSKNINDLNNLNEGNTDSVGDNEWCNKIISPSLWCNDQEPLDYKFYKNNIRTWPNSGWTSILKSFNYFKPPTNLNYSRNTVFDKGLLLHSEKRSHNVGKYHNDNELIPVYYWSHAVIARDWFRYAEHIKQKKQVTKTFLIYNRAWSNTREYRLRFAELLVTLGIQDRCKTNISPIEPELGIHYDSHQFKNSAWRPKTVLENYFTIGNVPSHYSADFDRTDYEATDIEVVLETLFDDQRLHLTEKSLRPIACAQPFILAGTHGSLEYLRGYGFKTFNSVWDESYDTIEDPEERLCSIADLMNQIANWLPHIRQHKMAEAQVIADYNQQHFFSKEFFDLVINELKTNLKFGFDNLELCNNYTNWITQWKELITHSEVITFFTTIYLFFLKLFFDILFKWISKRPHY
jgi:predicted XRE-type DNA-binding protein